MTCRSSTQLAFSEVAHRVTRWRKSNLSFLLLSHNQEVENGIHLMTERRYMKICVYVVIWGKETHEEPISQKSVSQIASEGEEKRMKQTEVVEMRVMHRCSYYCNSRNLHSLLGL